MPLNEAPRLAEKKEAAEAAASADAKPVVPRVRILDLSTAPPTEVSVLSAFGMQWAPIVQQPQAANIEVNSAPGGPSSAAETKQPLVTFHSVHGLECVSVDAHRRRDRRGVLVHVRVLFLLVALVPRSCSPVGA